MDVMGQLPALLFSLFAILVLIVGLGVLAARFVGATRVSGGRGGIGVLASTTLGGRERLVLVGVGERRVLVGVTQHSVTPVLELSRDETEAALGESAQGAGSANFASLMSGLLRQGRGT